jgi:hypothetical protein
MVRYRSLAGSPEEQAIWEKLFIKKTGTTIHPMSPLCKIIWMQKHAAYFQKA